MSERKQLTETQYKVYEFIRGFIKEHRYSPTIREIQDYFGWGSSNSVVSHLNKLRSKGYITSASTHRGMKSRTITLVDDIVGWYTVDATDVHKALAKMKENGYDLPLNEAVEFLKSLEINIKQNS